MEADLRANELYTLSGASTRFLSHHVDDIVWSIDNTDIDGARERLHLLPRPPGLAFWLTIAPATGYEQDLHPQPLAVAASIASSAGVQWMSLRSALRIREGVCVNPDCHSSCSKKLIEACRSLLIHTLMSRIPAGMPYSRYILLIRTSFDRVLVDC